MDLCHLKNFGVRASISKVQRQSRTSRWHCEGWFRIIRSIYWTRIISIANDGRQSHGHCFKTPRMCRTSSRCSFRLYPEQNGRCTTIIFKSQIGMSRYLDTSTETRMAQIMVQCGRPSRSSRKESVRSPFGRTIVGKANWESSFKYGWEKVPNWECLFVNREKDYSYLCMWTISNWLGRNQTSIRLLKFSWKTLIWKNQHHFLTMFLCVALKENARLARIWWIIRNMFESRIFCLGCGKITRNKSHGETWCRNYIFMALRRGRVMPRNARKDIANFRIKRRNKFSKSRRHAWMTINLKVKKWDQLETCPQFAYKLLSNVYKWLVLIDLIFYGKWTNLLVRWRNGQKHVTNVRRVSPLTLITHVNTGNIVMWRTQHNNADWDCFKILILQKTWKTRSQHPEKFCAFSEAEHLCQKVGCARNKHQFHTVLRKLKSSLSMQVYAWMGFPLSIFGIQWLKYCIPHQTKPTKPKM